MPGGTTLIELDLNKDPLVYIKTRGVRIVMPYDPAFITTSTAYFDFMAGRTRMLGLCVIKRRGRPGMHHMCAGAGRPEIRGRPRFWTR